MEEIGRNIIRLESVDSTNNYTANRVRAGELRHGAVILAVEQTQGRGQMGAVWLTEPGMNLTFSVYLDNVNLSVERQFILTKIVSLSLVDFLNGRGVAAKIKWPNDIYVGKKKIAGVLIENMLKGSLIKKSIIGIGLNTNQKEFGDLSATSLRLQTGDHCSNDEALFSLIERLNKYLQRIDDSGLNREYLDHLFRMGEPASFEDDNGVFEGTIIGVDTDGKLCLDRDSSVKKYSLKEIKFIL